MFRRFGVVCAVSLTPRLIGSWVRNLSVCAAWGETAPA